MKIESNVKMPLVSVEKSTLLLCYDEIEVKKAGTDNEESPVTLYQYESVRVGKTSNYNEIASASILDRYPVNEQLAIFTHSGDGNEIHEKEHEEFKQWCEHAKEIAKKIIGQ